MTSEPDEKRELLLQITREMATSDDLDQLLQMIVDAALRVIPRAEKCVIHLLEEDGTMLRPRICSNPWEVRPESAGFPVNVGIAGRVLQERRVYRLDDASHHPDFAALDSSSDLCSLLVAPLYTADAALGTLSLSSSAPGAFKTADSDYVRTLAAQAALALRQMHLLTEISAQRRRSDTIIESMADGLFIIEGGSVTRANAALSGLLGCSPEAFSSPFVLGEGEGPLRDLLDPAACIVGPYEVELRPSAEEKRTLEITPSELKAPAEGTVFLVRDVTRERTAAEKRGLFISQVSHELRTPLQHILSFVSLLLDMEDAERAEEELHRFLTHIESETYRLTRLMDDLLELSRIETGRFSVYMERVRVDQLVSDVLNRFALRAELSDVSFAFDDTEAPTWALTDPLRLEQVVVNLISNACKFAPPGSCIRVGLQHQGADMILYVKDRGPGIAPEEQAHVFEPFYRAESETSRPGMGLGLYISRRILEALGGEIWLESRVGEGSCFYVRLPRVEQPA
ncbi:MAG: GAF domain-containing sensor histidine kinase [Chloroflexota bacterium]|nr:GAF domain-containing sensor histidine kinase [Chloroflexota bacterium]